MGQVWSKANFDGTNAVGHYGGRGSVLAVTAQNPLVPANLNQDPAPVSVDAPNSPGCNDTSDRVRGFYSRHSGGAHFCMGDGATRFISENIDQSVYRALSTINGGEMISEF
jgi:prepilin-type processing-associated H-X9-DG protein